MKRSLNIIAALLGFGLVACSSSSAAPESAAATTGADANAAQGASAAAIRPLLFGIGLHIEPLGPTAQNPGGPSGNAVKLGPDYNDQKTFERGVSDIQAVAEIVEAHGGRLTVQAQSPFTTSAVKFGSRVLNDLEDAGHEIGLHFHEDAHLGKSANSLSVDEWCSVLKAEVMQIKQAGVDEVSYWSGGNKYPGLLDAAECAGLSVNSDWKDPATQTTAAELIGTVPWRPAGGTNGTDVSQFAKHDPTGEVVFLPEGNYDRQNFAASRRSDEAGGDQGYFDYLEASLLRSIETAVPGKVNVFHFTVHPGEFRGGVKDPFGVIDRFLAEVVDPLVREGKIQWATLSEMAAAFEQWEAANAGVDPRATGSAVAATPASTPVARPTTATGKGTVAAGKPGAIERDITYCTANGQALKMDIYRPVSATAPAPAVLYVHGGGWTGGDKGGGNGFETIGELVRRGYVVAAVNYRVAPQDKFPAQIEDVKCAVRYLRANATTYGIDPDRIGAMGGSAGGHLVSLLGTSDNSSGLEGSGGYAGESSGIGAVVDMFGPTDLTVAFNGANDNLIRSVFGATGRIDPVLKTASPVTWVSRDDPPFLILHGEEDELVPLSQSQELYERLTAAGVDAELVVVKNAGHGFAPTGGQPNPTRAQISTMIADFFDAHLK